MVEIEVNGTILPIVPGTRINREVETKIFTKDDAAYDFSYPIELPLTNEARIALDFPDIVERAVVKKSFAAQIIIDGISRYTATLKVLSASQITATCRITIVGEYANLAEALGDKRVCDLEMGGFQILEHTASGFDPINYNFGLHIKDGAYDFGELRLHYRGYGLNAYMTAVANGTIATDFLFPKAVDYGDSPGNTGGKSIINAWDAPRNRYVEADLLNAMYMAWKWMPDAVPANIYTSDERHFCVPMFRLIAVLKACFLENGIKLEGDILTDVKLQDVVLYNTHAINRGVSIYYDTDPSRSMHDNWLMINCGWEKGYLTPGNHLPRMKIIDFINELSRRYNWRFKYNAEEKLVSVNADKNLTTRIDTIVNLSDVCDPKKVINHEREDAFLNGYEFSFESDGLDSATSDDAKDDVDTFRFRGTVNEQTDIHLTFGAPLVGDIAYVRNVDSYFQYVQDDGWQMYSRNIGKYRTVKKENLQQITTKIISPPMDVVAMRTISLFPGYGHAFSVIGTSVDNEWEAVPYSNIGISHDFFFYVDWDDDNGTKYIEGTGIGHPWIPHGLQSRKKPIEHLPHLVSCVGFQTGIAGSSTLYFMATTGQYNSSGVAVNAYPGSWNNPENKGLYSDWWRELVERVADSLAVDVDVLMDLIMYLKIDLNSTKFKIDNLYYLCKKASIVLPLPETSKLSLVRI